MNKEMDQIEMKKQKSRLQRHRALIFSLTFMSYATLHCARQSWSYIKSDISNNSDMDDKFLGYMDFTFLMSYAIGLATLGHYGDRMNLKYFTSLGMLVTVFCLLTIGLLQLTDAIQGTAKKVTFILIWIVNGLSQSTGMPGFVAAMGNWFGKSKRGILMGFWIGTTNFGDIMGYILGGIMSEGFSAPWGYVPVVAAVLIFIMVVLLLLFMHPYPEKIGINAEMEWGSVFDDETKNDELAQLELLKKFNSSLFSTISHNKSDNKQIQDTSSATSQIKERPPINFFNAWLIPNVAIYAFLFSSLKSTVYGILFWLPTLLSSGEMKISQINKSIIISLFDVGIFIGGIIVGQLTDRIRKRAVMMGPAILFSVAVMVICICVNTSSFVPNIFIFFFIGLFLGGPYNVCQSAIMIDLARQKALQKSAAALSTVTSLIDGTGACISAIVQLIIPYAGVDNVFWVLLGLTLVSLILLSPLTIKDVASLIRRKKRKEQYYKDLENNNPRKLLNDKKNRDEQYD